MARLFPAVAGGTLLLAAALVAPGPTAAVEVKVSWDGDRATIDWREPLRDPKAKPGEPPFSVVSGPYIGWLGETEATVGWQVVAHRALADPARDVLSSSLEPKDFEFRSATLTGLKPDTAYRYRLTCTAGAYRYEGKEYTFRTLPLADAKSLRFAVIGDTQRYGQQPWTDVNARIYKDVRAWDPALILHVGDLVYTGWGEGVNGQKQWFRLFHLMRDLRASHWLAPALGNHDVQVGQVNWGPSYFPDLREQVNNASGKARPPFYYSFDAGNVHFVALSTELRRFGPDRKDLADERVYDRFTWKEQLAWAEADLKASRAPWKVVYFHQPLHTAGGYACRPEFREEFGRLFDRYGVQVLISGHDHSYQRTWRINNLSRERSDEGTVQVVSGGASNLHSRSKRDLPWNVHYTRANHYLRVEASDVLKVDAVLDRGELLESWRMKRTGQPETLKPLPANLPAPREKE